MVCRPRSTRRLTVAAILVLGALSHPSAQGPAGDPATRVRALVAAGQLDVAREAVAEWIRAHPRDLDARAWQARLLSWTNRRAEAEAEYRELLARAPDDVDLLAGLADVVSWQGRAAEALPLIERASALDARRADIEVRRAAILLQLGRTDAARSAYQEALRRDPGSADARRGLERLRQPGRSQVRVASAFDHLDYGDDGGSLEVTLEAPVGLRWTARGSVGQYFRFGEPATRVSGGATLRSATRWVTVGAAAAHDNGIVPRAEVMAEVGRSFRFSTTDAVRGLELTVQPHAQWYRDVAIARVTPGAILYLPREWQCLIRISATRASGSAAGAAWQASGWSRVSFPVTPRLGAFVLAAVGTEDSVYLDRVLAVSSHAYGGGLRVAIGQGRELNLLVQRQAWSGDRAQTSLGVSYGLRY